MVEMGDLLTQDEIFQKGRAARVPPERVLVVGKCHPLVGGERWVISPSALVQFAAGSDLRLSQGRGPGFCFTEYTALFGLPMFGLLCNGSAPAAHCSGAPKRQSYRSKLINFNYILACQLERRADTGVRSRCTCNFNLLFVGPELATLTLDDSALYPPCRCHLYGSSHT